MGEPLTDHGENYSLPSNTKENNTEAPAQVLANPALLFLYYRIEQILGIKAGSDSLIRLNDYLENQCGSSFIENPASYEHLLTSREQIFTISEFLTVNETYFFRESAHFDLLSDLLPSLIKNNRSLQICSAATSIGCEAYSLAMFFDYYKKEGLDFNYSIDAFDVSAQAIETAKNARYTSNTLRSDGSAWKYILDSYLINDNNEYIISHDIRGKVRFFNHNIMRGIDRFYDIIFFRNSLIYFSQRNRYFVINNLVESLNSNGLLFFGVSETASAKHPFLANRYLQDVFYFQKAENAGLLEQLPDNCVRKIDIKDISSADIKREEIAACSEAGRAEKIRTENTERNISPAYIKDREITLNFSEIAEILKADEGKTNAENTLKMLLDNENPSSLSGSQITAGAIFLLHTEDFTGADKIISLLEEIDSKYYTKFLRGEYFFLQGKGGEAEKYFQEAAVKNKSFWPAFYRIQSLASDGNLTRHEYKIKKTIESIELVQNLESEKIDYECFMGGFSPDYFRRILEKKLARGTLPQDFRETSPQEA